MKQFINLIKRRLEYVFYAGFGLIIIACILAVYWPKHQAEKFNTFIPPKKSIVTTFKDGISFELVKMYGLTKIKRPVSIFVDAKRLYISDSASNKVVILKRNGSTLAVISKAGNTKNSEIDYPYGIVPFSNDKILVADTGSQKIYVYKRDSAFVRLLNITGGIIQKPGYMLAKANEIYIADLAGHDIKIMNKDGNIIGTIATPLNGNLLLKYPQGMALDNSGNLWVADGGNQRIVCFNKKGQYLKSFNGSENGGNSFTMVKGLAILSNKYLCISDPMASIIRVFDLSNKFKEIGNIGGPGVDPGKFMHPMGLYVDGLNHLFVADRGNSRVQEFTIR